MSYFVTSFLNKDSAKSSISVIGAWRMNWFQSRCFSSCLYICSSSLATVVNLKTNVLRVKKLLHQQKLFYVTFFLSKWEMKFLFDRFSRSFRCRVKLVWGWIPMQDNCCQSFHFGSSTSVRNGTIWFAWFKIFNWSWTICKTIN